jgi:glutaredoxin-related protein
MVDTSEFNEVSQLRTRCTILESQIQVLEKQNADLKATITILHPDEIRSTDEKMKSGWKDVPKVGTFPKDDDGSFQV